MPTTLRLCAVIALLLAAGLAGAQPEQPRADLKVTLDVTNRPTAEVVAEVCKQTGLQVGIVGVHPEQVALNVQDATADQAVAALAEALGASWVRCYLLESQPPPTPFTPEQLLAGLQRQRDNWFESLTESQRQMVTAMAVLSSQARQGATAPPSLPGAGRAQDSAPAGTTAAPTQLPSFDRRRFDIVRQLILPMRTETVTLNLDNKPLTQALYELITASGFIVAAGADLSGEVTIQADKQPLEQIIAEIATAVGAQWRPVYLLAVPREMSEAEMDQVIDDGLRSRLARYWAKPPEERAQEIEQWVGRLGQWGAMAKQPGANGQPNLVAQGLQRLGPKVLSRLIGYSAGLTPAQRSELKPLVKALSEAIGQPQ